MLGIGWPPYGYEHRRTHSDIDMRVNNSRSFFYGKKTMVPLVAKGLQCPVCHLTFTTAETLDGHLETLAMPDEQPKIKIKRVVVQAKACTCTCCGSTFPSRNAMFRHLNGSKKKEQKWRVLLSIGFVGSEITSSAQLEACVAKCIAQWSGSAEFVKVSFSTKLEAGMHCTGGLLATAIVDKLKEGAVKEHLVQSLTRAKVAVFTAEIQPAEEMGELRRAVSKLVFRVAIPYSVLYSGSLDDKKQVHRRLRRALKRLATGENGEKRHGKNRRRCFRHFTSAKKQARSSDEGMTMALMRCASCGLDEDIDGEYLCASLSARSFMPEQVRRMVAVAAKSVRDGGDDFSYLDSFFESGSKALSWCAPACACFLSSTVFSNSRLSSLHSHRNPELEAAVRHAARTEASAWLNEQEEQTTRHRKKLKV